MPSWIGLFTKVDGGKGIFRVDYESARILDSREESLESKQVIEESNQEDIYESLGNTFLIIVTIEYFHNQ